MNKRGKFILFRLVSILLLIGVIEGMLSFLAVISNDVAAIVIPTNRPILADSILGHRPNPVHSKVFENDKFKTIFTSSYRLQSLNLEDPRMEEGLNISLQAIKKMNDQARKEGKYFVVLSIPTKEYTFRKVSKLEDETYLKLIAFEKQMWKKTFSFFDKYQIPYLKSIEALEHALDVGVQPFHASRDGHINTAGHRIVADEILDFIRRHE